MLDQTPVQIAWVTDDADATEAALTTLLGATAWTRMPGVHFGPDACAYRGSPADLVADISLSYAGDTQLEVISPVSGDSLYTEFLDQHGSGLHHVCRAFPDVSTFEAALDDAERAGSPALMTGTMPGGMRFGYVSAEGAGVPFIEFAYLSPEIRAVFDHIKQEQK